MSQSIQVRIYIHHLIIYSYIEIEHRNEDLSKPILWTLIILYVRYVEKIKEMGHIIHRVYLLVYACIQISSMCSGRGLVH